MVLADVEALVHTVAVVALTVSSVALSVVQPELIVTAAVLRETAFSVTVKLLGHNGAEAVVQNLALAVSAVLGVYSQNFIFCIT